VSLGTSRGYNFALRIPGADFSNILPGFWQQKEAGKAEHLQPVTAAEFRRGTGFYSRDADWHHVPLLPTQSTLAVWHCECQWSTASGTKLVTPKLEYYCKKPASGRLLSNGRNIIGDGNKDFIASSSASGERHRSIELNDKRLLNTRVKCSAEERIEAARS
jgi:hypothetical protein